MRNAGKAPIVPADLRKARRNSRFVRSGAGLQKRDPHGSGSRQYRRAVGDECVSERAWWPLRFTDQGDEDNAALT
jgi:hypothetical protein